MEGFQSTVPPDFAVLGGLRRSLTAWLEKAGVEADTSGTTLRLVVHA